MHRYWTKMRLNVHKENISQVLKSRVIQLVSRIKFESLGQNKKTVRILDQFLSAVVAGELSQLKMIMMAGCDLSSSSLFLPFLNTFLVINISLCST